MQLLELTGVSKAFEGFQVLSNIDVALSAGDVVLLRGENGSGKTTLLNILAGRESSDSGRIIIHGDDDGPVSQSTEFRFGAERLRRSSRRYESHTVAQLGVRRTWQTLRHFAQLSVRENVCVSSTTTRDISVVDALLMARKDATARAELGARADEKIAGVGLGERHLDQKASSLSYGESKRLSIARLTARNGIVYLLDEPLSGLDSAGADKLVGLLRKMVDEVGARAAFVIVEHVHSAHRLMEFANLEWLLEKDEAGGHTVRACKIDTGTGAQRVGAAAPAREFIQHDRKFCGEISLPGEARLLKFRTGDEPGINAIEVENVRIRRGNRVLFPESEGLSFSIKNNEAAVLLAPNGWGKSSLALGIVGLLELVQGTIRIYDEDVSGCDSATRFRLGMRALLAGRRPFPSLGVKEIARLSSIGQSGRDLVSDIIDRRAADLSGGEGQRLSLAAIPAGGRAMLLDEPFVGLDAAAVKKVSEYGLAAWPSCCLVLQPDRVWI